MNKNDSVDIPSTYYATAQQRHWSHIWNLRASNSHTEILLYTKTTLTWLSIAEDIIPISPPPSLTSGWLARHFHRPHLRSTESPGLFLCLVRDACLHRDLLPGSARIASLPPGLPHRDPLYTGGRGRGHSGTRLMGLYCQRFIHRVRGAYPSRHVSRWQPHG